MADLTTEEKILTIRTLVGDKTEPYKTTDLEITGILSLVNGDVARAASLIAQSIGAQYSEFNDVEIAGAIKVDLGETSKNYLELAKSLSAGGYSKESRIIPWEVPSVGGVYTGSRDSEDLFSIGMMDNKES